MIIADHKFKDVPFVSTDKKGGKIKDLKILVLHFTAGWTTKGDIETLAHSDRPASAHLVLSREGDWTQIVPLDTVAWHAGPSKWDKYVGLNNYSIGIEVSNIGYLKKLSTGDYIDEYGNKLKGNGEFYGKTKRKAASAPDTWHEHYNPILEKGPTYVWEPFYDKQLDALEDGVRAILAAYPSIEHIVTHEEIDTRGWKTDINGGRSFPMKRFTDLLSRNAKLDRSDEGAKQPVIVSGAVGESVSNPIVVSKSPDTNSEPFAGVLTHGDEVNVIHSDGKWAFIEFTGGLTGWLPASYLRWPF